MKLSKNFNLSEFEKSNTADLKGIDNRVSTHNNPELITKNIQDLVTYVLQPLRDKLNKPIYISSGFRCEKLNKLIGGVKTSQHLLGQAADITYSGNIEELYEYIEMINLPVDQVILYKNKNFIHISYSKRNRRQYLVN